MSEQIDLFKSMGLDSPLESEFFNTTNEIGKKLKKGKEKAKNQDNIIYDFFRLNKEKKMTPGYIHQKLFDEKTPITSVRRSITNLTNGGYLIKTKDKMEGIYGRDEYCWKFNTNI